MANSSSAMQASAPTSPAPTAAIERGLLEHDDLVFAPHACGPGDLIVISRVLENNAPNLWRLNTATGELKQLTSGKDEEKGYCTPDGKWVVFNGTLPNDPLPHILKIPIDGGTSVDLARGTQFSPPISPDGKLIAYGKTEGQGANAKSKIVLASLENGAIVKEIQLPPTFTWNQLAWAPGGRAPHLRSQHYRQCTERLPATFGRWPARATDPLRL